MLNRLTDTLNFQGQALSLRAERQRLLASNIANADTPGYVAREMDFAKTLRAATASDGTTAGGGAYMAAAGNGGTASTTSLAARTMAATQPGHILNTAAAIGAERESTLDYAAASQTSLDRNSVDMDRERASFADNTVKVEAALRFLNGSAKTLLDAIKGGS